MDHDSTPMPGQSSKQIHIRLKKPPNQLLLAQAAFMVYTSPESIAPSRKKHFSHKITINE
jgi:hypothetical protein